MPRQAGIDTPEHCSTLSFVDALMVTHNMNQALKYGNRMVMLHQGKIQLDIKGEEKQKLTVAEIVDEFGQTLKDETLLST